MKRFYFPNKTLQIEGFPTFEITSALSVHFRNDKGELRRADSLFLKKIGHLVISYEGKEICIKGYSQEEEDFIYEVKGGKNAESNVKQYCRRTC